jgi:hypothetical protein
MKTSSIGFAMILLTAAVANEAIAANPKPPAKIGDFKGADKKGIPGNTYGSFTFDDAQKDAVKKKKPLVLIVTGLEGGANADKDKAEAEKAAATKAFWAVEDDSVIVILKGNNAASWSRLPELVQQGLKSAGLGKEYPKLLATTDDATKSLAGLTAENIKALSEKDFNKFGKELKKLNAAKTPSTEFAPPTAEAPKPETKPATPPATHATTPPAPAATGPVLIKDSASEAWTNSGGQAIQAKLLEVNGDQITFEMANGAKVPYAINKLSPASQKRVEELKAANAAK